MSAGFDGGSGAGPDGVAGDPDGAGVAGGGEDGGGAAVGFGSFAMVVSPS